MPDEPTPAEPADEPQPATGSNRFTVIGMSLGLSLGLSLGTGMGLLFENPAIGMAMGMLFGISMGMMFGTLFGTLKDRRIAAENGESDGPTETGT